MTTKALSPHSPKRHSVLNVLRDGVCSFWKSDNLQKGGVSESSVFGMIAQIEKCTKLIQGKP